jgi:MoxR-like ATPase
MVTKKHIAYARGVAANIKLSEPLVSYIVQIIRATREHTAIETGASPRAANMLSAASRAHAAVSGRDFVLPDDIKLVAPALLRHRIILTPAADMEGLYPDQLVSEILNQVAAPR